ncbi:glycosyltransferase family 2 protein [Acinetobacter baumannii]|uniref:glycosyltransferase family 2 protein n=1 Tax=Acinetobacter baumannii TaxID=470 RepID=UPI0024B795ED|nr:glycosyltransferase [Acinetobacter baumannii]MCE6433041.1 glycosyltransferase [Acinetobacter baumannii]MDI9725313.1 glycosyltransferase [Acinetobacter baumannii]
MSSLEQPLVSVVIPCYNHENFVQDCIQSVLDQTYQNIELIIIDDGSKDNSISKIEEMTEKCEKRFVRFEFRHRKNKGLSATLNEALEWCQGEYYSAIASDDKIFNYKIMKQVNYLEDNKDFAAMFGAVELIDENNKKVGEIRQSNKIFTFNDLIYTDRFLPAPTQMIRLGALKRVGGFIDGMIIEDWYIYLKLLETGNKILYKDELYSYYRTHQGNTFSNPYKMAIGRLQVLNEFKQHELFKKAYIKVCWDNAFETLILDFKLSIIVLLARLFHKFKMIINKVFGSR